MAIFLSDTSTPSASMKKSFLLLLAVLFAGTLTLSAQARRALKINEVMVTNTNNFVDDYGERHGWIELFNSAHAPLEISTTTLSITRWRRVHRCFRARHSP